MHRHAVFPRMSMIPAAVPALVSRSEFYTRAVEAFLDEHRADRVREALDAVYGDEDSSVDSELAAMQSAAWTEE